MIDLDIVNLLNHLYFHSRISDSKARQVLHCPSDTQVPLQLAGIIHVEEDEWVIAPAVHAFLKMADNSVSQFPPKHWVFGSPLRDLLTEPPPRPGCFLAIPYGPVWFPAVRNAVEQATKDAGYEFNVALDISQPGSIMSQVWAEIRSARVVVADLTGLNANVFYELGLAHALGKSAILITQQPERLPFDVRSMRWHAYSTADLATLTAALRGSLDAVRVEIAPKHH